MSSGQASLIRDLQVGSDKLLGNQCQPFRPMIQDPRSMEDLKHFQFGWLFS